MTMSQFSLALVKLSKILPWSILSATSAHPAVGICLLKTRPTAHLFARPR